MYTIDRIYEAIYLSSDNPKTLEKKIDESALDAQEKLEALKVILAREKINRILQKAEYSSKEWVESSLNEIKNGDFAARDKKQAQEKFEEFLQEKQIKNLMREIKVFFTINERAEAEQKMDVIRNGNFSRKQKAKAEEEFVQINNSFEIKTKIIRNIKAGEVGKALEAFADLNAPNKLLTAPIYFEEAILKQFLRILGQKDNVMLFGADFPGKTIISEYQNAKFKAIASTTPAEQIYDQLEAANASLKKVSLGRELPLLRLNKQ